MPKKPIAINQKSKENEISKYSEYWPLHIERNALLSFIEDISSLGNEDAFDETSTMAELVGTFEVTLTNYCLTLNSASDLYESLTNLNDKDARKEISRSIGEHVQTLIKTLRVTTDEQIQEVKDNILDFYKAADSEIKEITKTKKSLFDDKKTEQDVVNQISNIELVNAEVSDSFEPVMNVLRIPIDKADKDVDVVKINKMVGCSMARYVILSSVVSILKTTLDRAAKEEIDPSTYLYVIGGFNDYFITAGSRQEKLLEDIPSYIAKHCTSAALIVKTLLLRDQEVSSREIATSFIDTLGEWVNGVSKETDEEPWLKGNWKEEVNKTVDNLIAEADKTQETLKTKLNQKLDITTITK